MLFIYIVENPWISERLSILFINLIFQGKLCPSVAFSSNSGFLSAKLKRPSSKKLQGVPDANVCRLLSCNFRKGHLCIYESKRVANSLSLFAVRDDAAATMLFERSKVAMLESPSFHLNSPARLHFDYSIEVSIVILQSL